MKKCCFSCENWEQYELDPEYGTCECTGITRHWQYYCDKFCEKEMFHGNDETICMAS